ncbi:Pycsar system effector family protein [Streptomyces sp. NPDC059168]|uniref:Pycsar system effector family protein n=1 Tax=Streptomyces sp. NPDC059168 TaxID=3346753 RepID=UPI0036C7AFD8
MSEASRNCSFPAASLVRQRLEARAAEMFVEMQRADGKATTLCGVAGGLLTVDAAALSALRGAPPLPVAVLACTAALLGMALVAALYAIRPVLRRIAGPAAFGAFTSGLRRPEEVVSAFASMDTEEDLRAEAERLALLAALARRKFRAVMRAVDLTAVAVAMAGIGLLSMYIPLEKIAM